MTGPCSGPGKTRESLKRCPRADLEVLCKQEVQAEGELRTEWMGVEGTPQHTDGPSVWSGRLISPRHLRKQLSDY